MRQVLLVVSVMLGLQPMLQGAEPEVIFKDPLKGKLGEGWTWLARTPKTGA